MIKLFILITLLNGEVAAHNFSYNSWGECWEAESAAVENNLEKPHVMQIQSKCVEAADVEELL